MAKDDNSLKYKKYEKAFSEKARENGYSEDIIIKCLAYAKPIISRGFPVIYNTTHLCGLVGYNESYIKRAAKSKPTTTILYSSQNKKTKSFYRRFSIKKKDGTERILFEPLPSLKEIQHWILNNILYHIEVSKYAKGYIPKRSIKGHLKYHVNNSELLVLDIANFFPSIQQSFVEDVFLGIGYSHKISNLLARLCCKNNSLPQGAPTSPYLSNIILASFDKDIAEYCNEKNLYYTRYADDLAFSTKKTKEGNTIRFSSDELIGLVKSKLAPLNLRLNSQKTSLMLSQHPHFISNISVLKKAQVPKKRRNDIRNQMFYIKKFGLKDHVQHINRKNETQIDSYKYLKHLLGKVNYVLTINSKDEEFIGYKDYLYGLVNEDLADESK
ncbi:reverse transcriptase family protein [Bernardetia sp. MNP-M8]|uniref:reverse transcriptase family protein n=1 Tax=Bernardetia sp. MNP-M8 TaxID=3127470 RepID=UPI0030D5F6A5